MKRNLSLADMSEEARDLWLRVDLSLLYVQHDLENPMPSLWSDLETGTA